MKRRHSILAGAAGLIIGGATVLGLTATADQPQEDRAGLHLEQAEAALAEAQASIDAAQGVLAEPEPHPVYVETFEKPDSAGVAFDLDWSTAVAGAGTASGRAYATVEDINVADIADVTMPGPDQYGELHITQAATVHYADVQILLRYADANNYYALMRVFDTNAGGQAYVFRKVVNGTLTDVEEVARPFTGPEVFQGEVIGDQLRLIINGALVDTWTDTSLASGEGVGLGFYRSGLTSTRLFSVERAEFGVARGSIGAPPEPEPEPTPTPTPTPTPEPPDDEFPSPATTGPREAPSVSGGSVTSSSAGQVISGRTINGKLTIQHDNVRVSDVIINGTGTYMIHVRAKADGTCPTGVLVEYAEVNGANAAENDIPIYIQCSSGGASGTVLDHLHVYNVGRSSRLVNNGTIQNSWIYSNRTGSSGAHRGGIGINGGANNAIINNVLRCSGTGCSAAIPNYGDFAQVTNLRIEHNLLATTGSYCAYGGSLASKPYPNGTNIDFIDNHFSTEFFPTCGRFGPISGYAEGVRGNDWTGNVWHESGAPLDPFN